MTPAQIYLDTPEIEHEEPDTKKSRTDSPRKLLPKLKNMSRCKARKGNV